MRENVKQQKNFKVNDEITNNKIRLIGENCDGSKVITLIEAQQIADEKELDLVEINQQDGISVVKLCNFEKMLYELKKSQKKKPTLAVKEIQLSVNIAMHDIEIKVKKAIEFINKGHKVKVILIMKGRELTRRDESKKSLLQFLTLIEDNASIESLKDEGNKSIAILKRKTQTTDNSKRK